MRHCFALMSVCFVLKMLPLRTQLNLQLIFIFILNVNNLLTAFGQFDSYAIDPNIFAAHQLTTAGMNYAAVAPAMNQMTTSQSKVSHRTLNTL